ncbi:MAG: type I-U CRISPR-associated protein Csb2, partial [bacterium]
MADYLCISVTFLDPRFHGRGDGGRPEWPPSPLRLMQAIVAANAEHVATGGELDAALVWLENQSPPMILAPKHTEGQAYRLSVPNNAMDLVAKAWSRGNYFGTGDSSPATHRTMKTVRPTRMCDGDTVHYLWPVNNTDSAPLGALARAAGRLVALGWGTDLVVARARNIPSAELHSLPGQRWKPGPVTSPSVLRVPTCGTLQALLDRHEAFINRISEDGLIPVPPLTCFDMVGYRRPTDPVIRPHAVFELRHTDGSFCAYSQRRLVHIAGMMRHLAKEAMVASPPTGADEGWVEQYVVGHRNGNSSEHRQFSYLPLPSIGHPHADHAVRRVMIAAPLGDDALLRHLARHLTGRQLEPENGTDFGPKGPPVLVRTYHDNVAAFYTPSSAAWASVTPVILPGHDDRKPHKTRKLIKAALAQSGVEQPCEFEWSAVSRFPKAYSAHKYDKNKRPRGYFRPKHLMTQTAVHLTLRFNDGSADAKQIS